MPELSLSLLFCPQNARFSFVLSIKIPFAKKVKEEEGEKNEVIRVRKGLNFRDGRKHTLPVTDM